MSLIFFVYDANPIKSVEYTDSGYFQGDIELTAEQKLALTNKGGRVGSLDLVERWHKNEQGQVMVPYKIRTTSDYSKRSFMLNRFIHYFFH